MRSQFEDTLRTCEETSFECIRKATANMNRRNHPRPCVATVSCLLPVLVYAVFVVEQTRPRLVCGTGTAGWFCFPAVAGVFFAGLCRQILSLVSCLFSSPCLSWVSLCLERDCELEGEHISR